MSGPFSESEGLVQLVPGSQLRPTDNEDDVYFIIFFNVFFFFLGGGAFCSFVHV